MRPTKHITLIILLMVVLSDCRKVEDPPGITQLDELVYHDRYGYISAAHSYDDGTILLCGLTIVENQVSSNG